MRPILEMIFDEGPNSYELSYGLPGHNLLKNKTYCDKRIHGIGNNYYQRCFQHDIINRSRQGLKYGFTASRLSENENCERNLAKYYTSGGGSKAAKGTKRKRNSAIDLILEE